MKRLFFAFAVLSATSPVHAAAPNDLVVTAGAARFTLASGHASLNMLDPASRALFVSRLQLDDPARAALWGRVMTGAVQIRRENGDVADTLWFNPLFDSGVVAHWTRVNGAWQARSVAAVTGVALRGETAGRAPGRLAWLAKGGDMGASLSDAARLTFAAAERSDWARLSNAPGDDTALIRAFEGNRGLYRMVSTPGYEHALGLIDHLMVDDDPAASKLPVAMRQGLAAYGDNARRTLSPVAAYRRPDGWTLAMQSPEAPQVVWLIHFKDPRGDDPAMPRGFVAVGQGPANPVNPGEIAQ